jgi:hypothetical protein
MYIVHTPMTRIAEERIDQDDPAILLHLEIFASEAQEIDEGI